MEPAHPDPLKYRLFTAQQGRCWLCGTSMRLTGGGPLWATYDHLVPVSRGGSHADSNLKLAHQDCNGRRGNRIHVTVLRPPRVRSSPTGTLPFSSAWLRAKGYLKTQD